MKEILASIFKHSKNIKWRKSYIGTKLCYFDPQHPTLTIKIIFQIMLKCTKDIQPKLSNPVIRYKFDLQGTIRISNLYTLVPYFFIWLIEINIKYILSYQKFFVFILIIYYI